MSADHPLHAFYRAELGAQVIEGSDVCWFCGELVAGGVEATEVVRSTFSDMARARSGGDGPVCDACRFYLDFKLLRPGGKRGMGLYTKTVRVWCGDRYDWEEWDREDMWSDLSRWAASGVPVDVYLTCNYSKQKHVLPWARVTRAGSRSPWVSTDRGDVHLSPESNWATLAWCIAWLWSRGYPKTLITTGALGAYQLSQSDDPATDLAALRVLAEVGPTPLLDLLSYITTETNRNDIRDSRAGDAVRLLLGHEPRAADSEPDRGDPQRGSRPVSQEPVPQKVVGHARGSSAAGREDQPRPASIQQYSLFQAGRHRCAEQGPPRCVDSADAD